MKRDELITAALAARDTAYAPYSHFQVGAAVETENGQIFSGCNVENASYGLTICAERVAICSAVAAGHRQFVACVVATPGGATPCGACRQFLAEFANHLPVLLVDADSGIVVAETDLADLLPGRFQLLPDDP